MSQAAETKPMLLLVSNAMVALHKEQFGRGPTTARAYFTGPDIITCVLEDVLLPAERKLVGMGELQRVREQRLAFQAATEAEFVAAIEHVVDRKIRSFASALDAAANVAYEIFYFEPDGRSRETLHAAHG